MYNVHVNWSDVCKCVRLQDFHLALDETRTVIERVILPRPREREPKCVARLLNHMHITIAVDDSIYGSERKTSLRQKKNQSIWLNQDFNWDAITFSHFHFMNIFCRAASGGVNV